jgi:hypothetical protein
MSHRSVIPEGGVVVELDADAYSPTMTPFADVVVIDGDGSDVDAVVVSVTFERSTGAAVSTPE